LVAPFYALLFLATFYAIAWGGAPERIFVLIAATGFAVTVWVETPWPYEFRHVELGVFFVDLAMFCALYLLSIFSTRFWPIWMTAMQGLVVLSHVVVLIPQPSAFGYQALEEFWASPQLILLMAAVYRRRRRLAQAGTDPAWTISARS
jgi:hypothetical protein